ncbi:MAG TPA: carboxypeptidase-like regulatory domain-containing protein, partial [Pyrinomonadaceae bacterium]|nr:carboxypeptidase-like regulatory domain-containing protein [Pyrinomonadaceae bacterium]
MGVITDPQGAVVAGATVLVVNERTGNTERTITTSEDGSFSATLLPPGLYRLEITSKNFKKATVKDVQVRINETTRQDLELEVGAVTETVVVQAA